MGDENDYGLSIINGLFDVVRRRLGSNNIEEVHQVSEQIMNSVMTHLDAGDQLAYLKRLEDGTLGLTTFSIDWGDED